MNRLADKLLRQWTYILAEPYQHGPMGRAWVVWVSVLNVGFGAFLILAPGWDEGACNAVLLLAIVCYISVLILGILGLRSPTFGPGLYVGIPLWLALLGWTIAVKMTEP